MVARVFVADNHSWPHLHTKQRRRTMRRIEESGQINWVADKIYYTNVDCVVWVVPNARDPGDTNKQDRWEYRERQRMTMEVVKTMMPHCWSDGIVFVLRANDTSAGMISVVVPKPDRYDWYDCCCCCCCCCCCWICCAGVSFVHHSSPPRVPRQPPPLPLPTMSMTTQLVEKESRHRRGHDVHFERPEWRKCDSVEPNMGGSEIAAVDAKRVANGMVEKEQWPLTTMLAGFGDDDDDCYLLYHFHSLLSECLPPVSTEQRRLRTRALWPLLSSSSSLPVGQVKWPAHDNNTSMERRHQNHHHHHHHCHCPICCLKC